MKPQIIVEEKVKNCKSHSDIDGAIQNAKDGVVGNTIFGICINKIKNVLFLTL
jgi:hypothetical protein